MTATSRMAPTALVTARSGCSRSTRRGRERKSEDRHQLEAEPQQRHAHTTGGPARRQPDAGEPAPRQPPQKPPHQGAGAEHPGETEKDAPPIPPQRVVLDLVADPVEERRRLHEGRADIVGGADNVRQALVDQGRERGQQILGHRRRRRRLLALRRLQQPERGDQLVPGLGILELLHQGVDVGRGGRARPAGQHRSPAVGGTTDRLAARRPYRLARPASKRTSASIRAGSTGSHPGARRRGSVDDGDDMDARL